MHLPLAHPLVGKKQQQLTLSSLEAFVVVDFGVTSDASSTDCTTIFSIRKNVDALRDNGIRIRLQYLQSSCP